MGGCKENKSIKRKHQGLEEAREGWIEVNHKVYEFVVGDRTHPQSESVYAKLESLREFMKVEGYIPQISAALDPCSSKEDASCGHSERLAAARLIENYRGDIFSM